MPFHFCADEAFAVIAALPFAGYLAMKVRWFFRSRKVPDCCEHPHGHQ